ncbi:hypothetical protein [Cribrihabitans neustonicus]|uniref:hypothetical protein n=1 Tax=Cribrihabitans neustonicus TaxID=1429085 RepID=UPI003B5A3EFD
MPDPFPGMPDSGGFSFTREGRSTAALLATAAWLAGLAGLWFGLGAAGWLVALLALPVIPAVLDLMRNPSAGLTISEERISWYSGSLEDTAPLAEIERVRFDTRWDFSVRTTLVMHGGKQLRLPQEATPPYREMERELSRRGLRTERHHFVIF